LKSNKFSEINVTRFFDCLSKLLFSEAKEEGSASGKKKKKKKGKGTVLFTTGMTSGYSL